MLRQHIITKLQEGLLKRVTTCDWFQTTEIWTNKCKTMSLVLAFLYAFMYIFLSTNLEHRSWSFNLFELLVGSWWKEDSLHWRTVRVLFWDLLDLLTSWLWEYTRLTQCPTFSSFGTACKKPEGQKLRDKLKGSVKMLVGIFDYLLYNSYRSRLDSNLWSNVSRASTSVVVKTN